MFGWRKFQAVPAPFRYRIPRPEHEHARRYAMKPDVEGLARRINKALLGTHPAGPRRRIERLALVAAAAEKEPDRRGQPSAADHHHALPRRRIGSWQPPRCL